MLLDKPVQRSFMNNKNNRGPRTLPWGTPDVTGFEDEVEPSMITF
jgi:hypothetical protein